jgi:hypothetical protein
MSIFGQILKEIKPKPSANVFEQEYSNVKSQNVFEGLLREEPPEPSYLTVASRSLARTTEQLIGSTIGGGLQWAGDILESVIPDDATVFDKAARTISEKGKQFRKFMIKESLEGREAPDPRIWQGSFMQNPSWKRAVGLVTGALPTLLSAYAVGSATLTATGNPVTAARAGGALIGLMVAPETYAEAREAGRGLTWSSTLGIARGVGEAVLESLPLRFFLTPGKRGVKAVASRIFTGAAIEGTEEVLQEIWSNTVAKIGYDKTRRLMEGVVESFIAGAGSGGALGAFTYGRTGEMDSLARQAGWTDKEWSHVLRDTSEQIRQNKDDVDRGLKSLGAAAKGFAYDGFLEQINDAKTLDDVMFITESLSAAEFTPKQLRKLRRALDKKKNTLGLISVKTPKQYEKEMRKAIDKTPVGPDLDRLEDDVIKLTEQKQLGQDALAELKDVIADKRDAAAKTAEVEVEQAAKRDDLLRLGAFLRKRGVQPEYRNPKTGKISATRKPGWKRVEEDAFITERNLPIKQGEFTWGEIAQELISGNMGYVFDYDSGKTGSPGDQLRIFVKDNMERGHFVTDEKLKRQADQRRRLMERQQRKAVREERRRVKAEAVQALEQEKKDFNFQLNSFRKILMQLGRDPTVENRRLVAAEIQTLTQMYDKDRPNWQKKMIGEVLDQYETSHKAMRNAFTREGEKIENLIPAMLGTMRESSINRARLPKWIKRPLQSIVQFYHYRSLRAARLFEMLDGYKHGENSKMYDWVNEARSRMLKDFNARLQSVIGRINEIGVNLYEWYKPSLTLSDVSVNQVSKETEQKVNELENGIKDKQTALNIISKSKGDIIIDKDLKVWLYAMLRDEGARGHLLEHGFLHDGDMIQLDAKHVDAIMNSMTEQELQVYETGREWFNDRLAELAPVYLDIKGRPLGKVENYFPIRVDRDLLVPEAMGLDEALMPKDLETDLKQREVTVEAPQYTKERTGSNLPLKGGYLGTILWYLGKSTHFIHMSGAVNDVEKIIRNSDYKKMVLRTRGRGMHQNLLKWLRDVKAYDRQMIFDPVADVFKLFRRNVGVSVLGLNLISSLRQSLSTFNAMAELGGPSPILSGWQQVMFNYKAVKDFVHNRSPQVRYRMVERDIEEIVRSKGAREIFGAQTRLSEKAMMLIRGMDRWTVLAVWKGAYDKILGETGNEKEAVRRADEVVRKTQPMADLKDLPMFFRGGEFTRMFTMFQNQINNNYNYWTQDILGKALAGEIETKDVAVRVLWSYMVPALIMGMINRGGPPEDLDDLGKDMITYPIAGFIFIGNIINSIIKGYSESLPLPAQQAEAFLRAFRSKDPQSAMWYSGRAAARLLGVPGMAQAERSLKGVRDLMAGHTEDVRRLIWSEWQLSGGEKRTGRRRVGRVRRRRRR